MVSSSDGVEMILGVPETIDAVDLRDVDGYGQHAVKETLRRWLGALDPDKPVSLYLHVPFCRQLCWYCGCNMKLAARYEPVEKYVDVLAREVDLVAGILPARMKIDHLHWGRGTPTALEPDDLERMM